jgi:hypothetical protein
MATYRDVIFWNGATGGDCEATVIRARLLGMTIDPGDDDDERPDKMTAFYEVDGGGIIVYEVDCFEADGRMTARWQRVASLEEVRHNRAYAAYLERLGL